MTRDEDEQQRLITKDRMRKGKTASTASTRREKVDQNPYVPKTLKRRDPRIVGEGSQSQMLDHDGGMDRDREIDLMTRLLGMSDAAARVEIRVESAGHISYPTLKRVYEDHLTEARRLENPQTREEMQEEVVVCEEFSSISRRLCAIH